MALFKFSRNRIELLGYSFERNRDREEVIDKNAFSPPPNLEGAALTGGGMQGYFINFADDIKNDALLIQKYRDAAQHPEFDRAISDIISESISFDQDDEPVKLNLDALEKKLPANIIKKIHEEFAYIMQLLNFRQQGTEIFKRWYVDGRLYFHKILDKDNPEDGIQELRYIHPAKIKLFREVSEDASSGRIVNNKHVVSRKYIEYYIYNDQEYYNDGMNFNSGLQISTDTIAHINSGLFDPATNSIISHVHKALRDFNQLRMMEDAVVIAKFTRAPQRRAFFIDVGQAPAHKADQIMQNTINQHRNKMDYDSKTGEFNLEKRQASMMEDYWFPKRGSERSTEIDILSGDNAFADMTDVEYFRRKLYMALNVPVSRLEPSTGFNMGRSSEISRDEVIFQHFVNSLRHRFNGLFLDILKTQLVAKNIFTFEDFDDISYDIDFIYAKDSAYEELRNLEIWRERISVATQFGYDMQGLFPKKWIQKNLLQLTDKEIDDLEKELAKQPPEENDSGGFGFTDDNSNHDKGSPDSFNNFFKGRNRNQNQSKTPEDKADEKTSPKELKG